MTAYLDGAARLKTLEACQGDMMVKGLGKTPVDECRYVLANFAAKSVLLRPAPYHHVTMCEAYWRFHALSCSSTRRQYYDRGTQLPSTLVYKKNYYQATLWLRLLDLNAELQIRPIVHRWLDAPCRQGHASVARKSKGCHALRCVDHLPLRGLALALNTMRHDLET